MKNKFVFLFAFFVLCFNILSYSQTDFVNGAWESKNGDKESVLIFQDGYFTWTEFIGNKFLESWGGPYTVDNNQAKILVEFNSASTEEVGKQSAINIAIKDEQLAINVDNKSINFSRFDHGKAPLAGVWKITAREQNGKLVPIHQSGARKTLKVLTGTRFQWFAINPETKQFSGTGGGVYSFVNGKYTENIQFFSRDSSRVGSELTFNGKLEKGEWHHSGLSSKGEKIYEVWGKLDN